MTYSQAIDFLFNQLPAFETSGPGDYKPGLATAYALSEAFGNPHADFRSVHVAGTNGKGSTSHMIASVLMEAGYKVGLYTSPHLFDFRERIRVDGEMIDAESVADFVRRYRGMDLDYRPTFFELTTIMAFEYFSRHKVDVAVIETGLGGRLDTTNIITPMASVITNVSLDHMAQLGDTVQLIAREKAGIIKPHVPVIIGHAEPAVRPVFDEVASSLDSPLIYAEDSLPASLCPDSGKTPEIRCDLTGDFQRQNINTVLHVLDVLDMADAGAVERGLSRVKTNTGLMCRWEEIDVDGRHIILDPGHNAGAWQYTAPRLNALASQGALWIVLGFSADKDIAGIMASLPERAEYVFVQSSGKRARTASDLLDMAKKRGLKGHAFDKVSEGVDFALTASEPGSTVFIGGSFYVLAELPGRLFKAE